MRGATDLLFGRQRHENLTRRSSCRMGSCRRGVIQQDATLRRTVLIVSLHGATIDFSSTQVVADNPGHGCATRRSVEDKK